MSENTENTDFVSEDEINKAVAELTADGYLGDDYDTNDLEKASTKKADDDEEEEEVETNAEVEEVEEEEEDAMKANESRAERADVDSYEYEEGMIDGLHDKDKEEAEKKGGMLSASYKAIKGGKGAYHKFNKAGTKRIGTDTYMKKGDKFVANTIKKALTAGTTSKPISTNNPNEVVATEVKDTIEVTPILKSFQDTILSLNDENNKKFQSTGTILKGLLEQIENLSNKVDGLSKAPNARKSTVRAPYTDRFAKAEKTDEARGLSITNDKSKILNMMDDLSFNKGEVDMDMAKAMSNFETTNRLPQTVALRIEKELGVRIYN